MFEQYTEEFFKQKKDITYAPYPKASDREKWENISTKDKIIKNAEQFLDYELTVLKASGFMHNFIHGEAREYEREYFRRRSALAALVLGECAENKGRFMPQTADIIWAICEESTWAIPSHNYVTDDNMDVNVGNLCDIDNVILDLFAGETASLLSFAYYLLYEKLYELSPYITLRIEKELSRRIIKPYLKSDKFFWMMFKDFGWKANNWTPWITSNVLFAVLLTEKNPENKAKAAAKALRTLERYIAEYSADGGCDEGVGYWYKAAGCIFDILDAVGAVAGKNLIASEEKLYKMIEYPAYMQAYDNHFASYADGNEKCVFTPEKILKMAKSCGSAQMKRLAAELFKCRDEKTELSSNLNELLTTVFGYDETAALDVSEIKRKNIFMPVLQVVCMNGGGFFVSAKGGHNNETPHNHNDVGNVVVYYKDTPVIVDMGVGHYCKKHWGDQRYELMTNRSMYHNLPVINGFEEMKGEEHCAENAEFDEKSLTFRLDVTKAYPHEADINRFERTVKICDNTVKICDLLDMGHCSDVYFNMITPQMPDIGKDGHITLGKAELYYDNTSLSAEAERLVLDDRLSEVWQSGLFRIIFKCISPGTKIENVFEIKAK